MELNALTAISPIDGRYRRHTEALGHYFSEAALIKYRVRVEIEYFIALCQLPLPQLANVDTGVFESLRDIYRNFSESDALEVKEIEKTTNHDVKAVEYFIKSRMDALNLGGSKEFVHFGLTSQDINNTAIPLSIKEALEEVVEPSLHHILKQLQGFSEAWKDVSMLARTHGQPASPTRLGKEIGVFCERLAGQMEMLKEIRHAAKFGGATGNFNAHHVTYPQFL
ncbi:MAG: adenylosuccinate lyase, partial [Flavobacteriales bacterium]|nr:adenylosuccinate lyase [Flavobacteriales bacterium]